jgi:hypothetical protein
VPAADQVGADATVDERGEVHFMRASIDRNHARRRPAPGSCTYREVMSTPGSLRSALHAATITSGLVALSAMMKRPWFA